METDKINRGINESVNNCRLVNDKYEEVEIKLLNNEIEHYKCLSELTREDRHKIICRNTYDSKHLLAFIENSTHYLFYRNKETKEMIGFALLKVMKKHKLDIILLCAMPNKEEYGSMIAYGAYRFAIKHKCTKIIMAPRTPALRETFVRHGYITYHGTKGIDEVLEKPIHTLALKNGKTCTTRKNPIVKRLNTFYNLEDDDLEMNASNLTNASKKTLKRSNRTGRYTLKLAKSSD